MVKKILRMEILPDRVGLRRSSIYAKVAAGDFPKPIPLGSRAVGWLESEIEAWLDAQAGKRQRGNQ